MIEATELRGLVRRLEACGVAAFEGAGPGLVLRLKFGRPRAGAPALPPPAPDADAIRSPGMGVVAWRHPLGGHEPVPEGARVNTGQLVAFLQGDDVLEPIVAQRGGGLGPRRVAEGALVGYGQPLVDLL